MDKFLVAYIEAALWSSMDESTPEGGEPLDKNYGIGDLAPETLKKMRVDCERFQDENADDILYYEMQAGHDFWLTRNGHGAGFWDDGWSKEVGDRLTHACRAYPEVNLYLGDDGLIYC